MSRIKIWYFKLVILNCFLISSCATVTDYTPLIAPSTGLNPAGLYIEGIPRPADTNLNSTQLVSLNHVRYANSFSLIFKAQGNPIRAYIDNSPLSWTTIRGYRVMDIPRDVCRDKIRYNITARTLLQEANASKEIAVKSGLFVEKDNNVDYVYAGANNIDHLYFIYGSIEEAKVRHYFHNRNDVAKLAIRSITDNPDIDVQVKSITGQTWQTLGTGWIEFDLDCGEYFLMKAERKSFTNPALNITENIDISIVDNNGIYGQGYSLYVTATGNPN